MTPSIAEGDPGKYAYLRNPNWKSKPFEFIGGVRAMPGTCERCVFDSGLHAPDCVHYVFRSKPWDTSGREAD